MSRITLKNGIVVDTDDGPDGLSASWTRDRAFCRYRCSARDPSLLSAFLEWLGRQPAAQENPA